MTKSNLKIFPKTAGFFRVFQGGKKLAIVVEKHTDGYGVKIIGRWDSSTYMTKINSIEGEVHLSYVSGRCGGRKTFNGILVNNFVHEKIGTIG